MSLVTRPFVHVTELDSVARHDDHNVADPERIASVGAGTALLATAGVFRRSPWAIALGLLGGALVYRGLSGRCALYKKMDINLAHPHEKRGVRGNRGIKLQAVTLIRRPAGELYHFWRNLENLPRFMPHLESVKEITDRISHWAVKGPLRSRVEWDAEIIEERPGKIIAWQTLPGAIVASAGSVRFDQEGEATRVKVCLQYEPVGGMAGATVAKLLGVAPEQHIAGDLVRWKELMEGMSA